jgi:hypothetical protein
MSEDSSAKSILSQLQTNSPVKGIFLVTGERGAGKTTWLAKLADAARQAGYQVKGLLSPGTFENGVKVAINLVDLATQETRVMSTPVEPHLAARRAGIRRLDNGDLVLGCWLMYEEVLQWGNDRLYEHLHASPGEKPSLLIIDELGPLEFNHGLGFNYAIQFGDQLNQKAHTPTVCTAPDGQKFEQAEPGGIQAAFIVVRPDLIPKALTIWPQAHTLEFKRTMISGTAS